MNIKQQIEKGILVSPKTKKTLKISKSEGLITEDGREKYRLFQGEIPILLVDNTATEGYLKESPQMLEEYEKYQENPARLKSVRRYLSSWLLGDKQDYRNRRSVSAFQEIFDRQNNDSLLISIGGGPTRAHPQLINLNIGLFPNVEIVADAHLLPYGDNSVDAIHCEAVLEHLKEPKQAVSEMYRVLKPGGKVFACTPFLQHYHGYPNHYQNFTLTGHQYLFSGNGFKILEAGPCVGPIYTMLTLTDIMLASYLPPYLAKPINLIWRLAGRFLYPLDRLVNAKENACILASTTYLVASK